MSISASKHARARRLTIVAIGSYELLSDRELIQESAGLHEVLAGAAGFGPVAARGIRDHAIGRLLMIDQEHQRRSSITSPTAA